MGAMRRVAAFLRRARPAFGTATELAGIGLLVMAAWQLHEVAGLAVAGAGALVVGVALGGRRP